MSRRLAIVRAVTFGYAAAWLVVRGRYVWDVAALPPRRFQPTGLLALGWQPGRVVVITMAALALGACSLAAAGRRLAVTAPVGALGMLLIATFTSSFGQIFHTEHLLVLHLLVLAGAGTRGDPRGVLTMLGAVTAVTYVVAGVTKLRMSGVEWVTGDVLRNWVAVDNLRKLLLDDAHSSLGGQLAGVAWIWPPIAVATLAVELGAPVAMLARSSRTAWVAAAWLFHVGVLALMAISFPYQLSGVAYLALLPVERIEDRLRHVARAPRAIRLSRSMGP